MKTPPAMGIGMAVALLAALGAGCVPVTGGLPTDQPAATETLSPTTATAPPSPTATPATTPTAPSAAPTAAASIPASTAGEAPPLAELRAAGGPLVPGKQGSWCYASACADIVVGPADALPEIRLPEVGALIELALPAPHRFVYWRAVYRDAEDETAEEMVLAEGGSRPDPDVVQPSGSTPPSELTSVAFEGPPSGSWVLRISLAFAGGLGDAAYYWHAVVP